MVIKLITCRYDFLAKAAVTCMWARKSYLRRYDFLAFHGKSEMQIRHRNDWISSLLVYFKNFNNICIVYEYQPFPIVKFTFSLNYKHNQNSSHK